MNLGEMLASVQSRYFEWAPWALPGSWVATMRSRALTSCSIVVVDDGGETCTSITVGEPWKDDPRIVDLAAHVRARPLGSWRPHESQLCRVIPMPGRWEPFGAIALYGGESSPGHPVMYVDASYREWLVHCFLGWECELRDDDPSEEIAFTLERCVRSAFLDRAPGPRIEWRSSLRSCRTKGRRFHRVDWNTLAQCLANAGRGEAEIVNWRGDRVAIQHDGERWLVGGEQAGPLSAALQSVWRHCVDEVAPRAQGSAPSSSP